MYHKMVMEELYKYFLNDIAGMEVNYGLKYSWETVILEVLTALMLGGRIHLPYINHIRL